MGIGWGEQLEGGDPGMKSHPRQDLQGLGTRHISWALVWSLVCCPFYNQSNTELTPCLPRFSSLCWGPLRGRLEALEGPLVPRRGAPTDTVSLLKENPDR